MNFCLFPEMPIPTKRLFTLLRRSFATTTAVSSPTLRCRNRIYRKYKLFVVQESQKALTEYLHATQGLPFFFADLIAKSSLFSLSNLLRNVPFSASAFPATLRKALRYRVINEFEFFFESIGIHHLDIPKYLPRDRFFLASDGGPVLEAAMALFRFGFPWNTLGKLYVQKVSIFSRPVGELMARLRGVQDYCGLYNSQLVGACLAFPELLVGEGDFEALFEDVKRVLEEFNNVDSSYEICCKIRFLYELGCERGTVSEKRIPLGCPKQVLEDKANFFCKFGVGKHKVGPLLLRNPEFFDLDLRTSVISVSGLLYHFGLDAKELRSLSKNYHHVLGRNKMGNLPGIVRALDLHEWFFNKIESLGCQIFVTYAMDYSDEEVDKKFQEAVKTIESTRRPTYTKTQLEFLMGLGFGENEWTLTALRAWLTVSCGLPERFDHLLSLGIKYSEVCLMIKRAPRILCLNLELMEKKVDYICNEMGSSIKHLVCFPRILVFDLENRMKPRHRFFVWLRQTGLSTKNYSVQSILDLSQKRFIARIFRIHRAAPKLYLECYLSKS